MIERPIILNGPPASGKSTVGKALAEKLNRPFLDTDRLVEEKAGKRIPKIFQTKGEPYFRELERAVVEKAMTQTDAIIAVGGGALVDKDIRHRALREAYLFSFRVPINVLEERADIDMHARPLHHLLERKLHLRDAGYHEAHMLLQAPMSVEEMVEKIVKTIPTLHDDVVMPLGKKTYLIKVDSVANLKQEIEEHSPSKKLAVIDETISKKLRALQELSENIVMSGGDQNKGLENVAKIWNTALEAKLDRNSMLIGIGGGVITDLTGFAAATLLRGIRFISVPTTLLAMVDASVGGKTGFDHALGKNLIGAFHQPSKVVCDPKFLKTLPKRELRSGLAEIVKIALISDEPLLEILDVERMALRELDLEVITSLIPKAIQAKVNIVCEDEMETKKGVRELLNFGHTAGHAIESLLGYEEPHGLCVAQGMRIALALGEKLGVTAKSKREWAETLLADLAFPVLGNRLSNDHIIEAMKADKKRDGQDQRFVLMQDIGEGCVKVVDEANLRNALEEVKI